MDKTLKERLEEYRKKKADRLVKRIRKIADNSGFDYIFLTEGGVYATCYGQSGDEDIKRIAKELREKYAAE